MYKTLHETIRAIEDAGFMACIRTRSFEGDPLPAGRIFTVDARRERDGLLVECVSVGAEGVSQDSFAMLMRSMKKVGA